jgi:hypothetical protein
MGPLCVHNKEVLLYYHNFLKFYDDEEEREIDGKK